MIEIERERRARYLRTCRVLVLVSTATAVFYLSWLLFQAPPANPVLFRLLLAAELFNITQAAGFWYTIWNQRWNDPPDADFSRSAERVDAFVTVCGEPAAIVEPTVRAVTAIRHPRLKVWVLDDGQAPEIEAIARDCGAKYVTRTDRKGAKAGNINHALGVTHGDFVVIFDADHVPFPSFLERTIPCFGRTDVAYVQTPQVYRNRGVNRVAAGAHAQQSLFYGPIMRGKDALGAGFSCGTNVVFRRAALQDVGGIPEDSVTEDLRISLLLGRLGWSALYLSEVLAQGFGPVDVKGYFSQQKRWAVGALDILLRRRPFHRGMRFGQAAQYFLSFMYWFNGWAYASYIILTLSFLLFGLQPTPARNEYPIHFLPYVFATLFTIIYAAGFTLRFSGLWFTLASFPVQISALVDAVFRRSSRFAVTSKVGGGTSLRPVRVQAATVALLVAAIPVALLRAGLTPSVVNNIAFAAGHILILSGFVRLALRPEPRGDEARALRLEQLESEAR